MAHSPGANASGSYDHDIGAKIGRCRDWRLYPWGGFSRFACCVRFEDDPILEGLTGGIRSLATIWVLVLTAVPFERRNACGSADPIAVTGFDADSRTLPQSLWKFASTLRPRLLWC